MPPEDRTAVLVLCDPERAGDLAPFCADLRQSGRFQVEMTTDPERVRSLDGFQVLFAHRNHGSLSADQADAVARFAEAGGSVVAVGATLRSWAAHDAIAAASGWTPNGRTLRTELDIERPGGGDHFRVVDMFHLLPEAPDGASPLLVASWRQTNQVVAYRRRVGDGSFTYVGLGHDPQAYASEGLRRALARTVEVRPAQATPRRPLGVGLVGFGALGPAHAAALSSTEGLRLAAVCDRDPRRREAARELEVPVFSAADHLYGTESVDVVLVATPPPTHAELALQALEAGKHVVCEKPFAIRVADCDRMIERASAAGLTLTVFQNRRWDPDFLMLQRVVRSGALGDVFHVETFVGGFAHPCHLWHSHDQISGGLAYDWGSHYIDWILQLVGRPVVAVRGQDTKRVWHDVTNADHMTIDIRFDGGAVASFVQSEIAAAMKPKWYVLGTRAAVVGDWRHTTRRELGPDGELDEHRVLPTDLPARLSVLRPDGDGGTHREALALPPRDRSGFYRNLAAHLLHHEPLAVQPQQARRVVAVLEAASRSASQGGALVELRV